MKKECACCGKSLGALSQKFPLADGVVCGKCWGEAGLGSDLAAYASGSQYTTAEFLRLRMDKMREQEAGKNFRPTKAIGAIVAFDDNTNTFQTTDISGFKTSYRLFQYDQIVDFELLEDGESVTKGGLGRAVVGGMLFGGAGAVVGAVTGGKKTKGICTSMRIKITLRNADVQTVYLDFIKADTKRDSGAYQKAREQSQDALSALQLAVDKMRTESAGAAQDQSPSAMDELLKLKQLLDMGAITQEEYDAKKKQLLAL